MTNTEKSRYGDRFETSIIVLMSALILLAMFGAWSLMSSKMGHCNASDYTYCGETEQVHH
ncbi:MAG: hypothetical protein R3B45_12075 [Bdellovibrionota bacterium]